MDNFHELFKDSEHGLLYEAIVRRDDRITSLERFRSNIKTGLKILAFVAPLVVSISLAISFK